MGRDEISLLEEEFVQLSMTSSLIGPCSLECNKKDLTHAVGSTFGGVIKSEVKGEFCRLRVQLDAQRLLRRGIFISTGDAEVDRSSGSSKKVPETHQQTNEEVGSKMKFEFLGTNELKHNFGNSIPFFSPPIKTVDLELMTVDLCMNEMGMGKQKNYMDLMEESKQLYFNREEKKKLRLDNKDLGVSTLSDSMRPNSKPDTALIQQDRRLLGGMSTRSHENVKLERNQMENVRRKCNFNNGKDVDTNGTRGGLSLVWNGNDLV
ncbi:hypothetical protein Goari_026882 [Gossypium aridum]|uniref:Uncharacterized protein n=1 Tax=Gossypium aridum TaxID=34290 RepID=A0A7J8YPE1_GOSAI|nr:hypothetical protein [Gossypium aridum]